MRDPYPISTPERTAILLLSFIVFAFFASSLLPAIIDNYNESVAETQRELLREAGSAQSISFGISDCRRLPAGLHLMTFFIFLSLLRPKRFIAATVLALFYLGLMLFALYLRVGYTGFGTWSYSSYSAFFDRFHYLIDAWDGMAAV